MKKILSLVLVISIFCSLAAVPSFASETAKNRPVVILKMDDLTPNTINGFQRFADVANELGILSCDGKDNTVWSAEGMGKWICYDLGEVKSLTKASIMWNNGDKRKSYYKVYLSIDGENFEKVFDGETSGTNAGYNDVLFGENKSARFVKIEYNGNSSSKWNAIEEARIY